MDLFATKNNNNNPSNTSNNSNESNHNSTKQQGAISNFLSGNKPNTNGNQDQSNDLLKEISTLSRKTRINEERSLNVRKKLQMIEHNMLANQKKIITEFRYLNEEINELKKEISGIKSKISTFAHELSEVAKKEDVSVLERYINIWEPVNFVTRKEVERLINYILEEKGIKNN
jgi:predicted  nucleic acid-binding Zn-ribbon protein